MSKKGLSEEATRSDWETRSPLSALRTWKLEDAKARFSEVVRRARAEGAQRVTVRGKDAVVVIAAEEYEPLKADTRTGADLAAFLQTTGISELDIHREEDRGRDVELW